MARPSKEEYLEMARQVVEQRGGTLLSQEYVSAKSKLNIQCAQKHLFNSRWSDLKQGKWCRKCYDKEHAERMAASFRTVDELRKFARIEHDGDCLATEPVSMNTKVLWKCKTPLHEPFPARLLNVLHQGTWCPACDAERRRLCPPRPQISRKAVESLLAERCIEITGILGEGWKGSKTRLKLRCANGHPWDAEVTNLIYARSGCPDCPWIGERIARAIFEATFGSKFLKCRPRWLEEKTGRVLELDGYSESLQLAFEYQGPRHFTDDDVRARDVLKREACLKQGVKLVEIEWAKKLFPPSNVLTNVARALSEAGIPNVPIMPEENLFRGELDELQRFAKEEWGGSLVSTVYGGEDAQHEWHCGNPDHPTWPAEPWRVKKRGHRCPSCAGNRPLGLEGLRSWGESVGLELIDTEYHRTNTTYNWRCKKALHTVRRSKYEIQVSINKGHSACSVCSSGRSTNVMAIKAGADEFAGNIMPIIANIRQEGFTSFEDIAKQLNERGVPTRRGGTARWHAPSVRNIEQRPQRSTPEETEK
jgi:hypothetical protein